MRDTRTIQIGQVVIECRTDPALAPSVLRAFAGATPLDAEVDRLLVPEGPRWLRAAVLILRSYRERVAPRLGQRCVFEPSCSRYAELALRRYGTFRGLLLVARRLSRCRPGRGGVDLP